MEKETKENYKAIKKIYISKDNMCIKNKIKKDINIWLELSDLKNHTWHNHETQFLENEMLKYEIEKTITKKKSKIKNSN